MPAAATAVHLSSSGSRDGGPSRISDFFYLAAIALLGALLYCNAIHGQFIWDDRAAVVRREDTIRWLHYIRWVLMMIAVYIRLVLMTTV